MNLLNNISYKIKALYKYLLSFLKKDWELKDYPIRFKYQKPDKNENTSRLQLIPWHTQIINWWTLCGSGNTKEESYNDLLKYFQDYKEKNKLPRPGTKVPLKFASTDEIKKFDHLLVDFFYQILNMNYNECFISDESSLLDFNFSESIDNTYKKIYEIYKVDVSDIKNGNLVEILKRINLLSNNY